MFQDTRWLQNLPDCASVLYPDQLKMLADTEVAMRTARRVLVQGATGVGKTHIIATIVAAAVKARYRVVCLATRTRLVRQLHDRLRSFDVQHGVIAASLPEFADAFQTVQIASVDTLYRRCIQTTRTFLPKGEVVIFDEAHLALGASRQRILDSYPDAWKFGFTATPALTSGRGLAKQFDALVLGPRMSDLIAQGRLVKPLLFAKPIISKAELNRLPKSSADYQSGAASKLMSRPRLIGDVVENWLRIANGAKTLVFACDKAHGALLCEDFNKAGVSAEQIVDDDDEEKREAIIARLESGQTKVVINCFLLSYGIDIPSVQCIVLARPTRSLVLFLQAVGRGMRACLGKIHFKVIDHGRVIENLGRPWDDFDWTLEDRNVNEIARAAVKKRAEGVESAVECPECGIMWYVTEDGSSCPGPGCDWEAPRRKLPVQITEAELVELEAEREYDDSQSFYQQALFFYKRRWPERARQNPDAARVWCWMRTKDKFKFAAARAMPRPWWNLRSVPCGKEVEGFLKAGLIRYWKSQASKRVQRQIA